MKLSTSWESIDVHLLQILRALLSECSVSSAARKLNLSQPAVSTALRRLRDITGDPLLVRSRNGMTPTERGMALLEPVKIALQQIETLAVQQVRFNPAQTRRVFNIATPRLPECLAGQPTGGAAAAYGTAVADCHPLAGAQFRCGQRAGTRRPGRRDRQLAAAAGAAAHAAAIR